jgi:hypothetical protein
MTQRDTTVDEQMAVNVGYELLELVVYVNDLKIIGHAHFGVTGRHGARRASDYIRAYPDKRLTLSDVRVYKKDSADLYDAAPFMIVNLDAVDLLYSREPNAGRVTEGVLEAEEEA